jgi:hypothetical protein
LGKDQEPERPSGNQGFRNLTGADMADLAQLIAWCKNQRAFLKQQLDMLESGQMSTFETRESGEQVDTTAETIRRTITLINDLDALLAEEDEAETEANAKGHLPSAI